MTFPRRDLFEELASTTSPRLVRTKRMVSQLGRRFADAFETGYSLPYIPGGGAPYVYRRGGSHSPLMCVHNCT